MRTLLPLVVAAVLLPMGVSAQRNPRDLGAIRAAPPAKPVSQQQATETALAKVRGDVARGELKAWGAGTGGGLMPGAVAAPHTLFNPTGGHSGNGVYVVEVTAGGARGHVRVVVDARTGAVVSTRLTTWDWGASPDWWKKGASGPPAS